jgi:uncharacterized membrane protein (UPF0127 family)
MKRAADGPGQPYAVAQVPGLPRLELELAMTEEERSRGLMLRTSLPANHGMLFVFERRSRDAFWNLNTLVPLSVAYLERDGTIVDIQDLKAQTPGVQPEMHPPAVPYLYALETNQGWFERHGVAVGDVLRIYFPSQ